MWCRPQSQAGQGIERRREKCESYSSWQLIPIAKASDCLAPASVIGADPKRSAVLFSRDHRKKP